MTTAALREPDLASPSGGAVVPAVAPETPLCTVCHERPRLGTLARCKRCLREASDATRRERAEAEARVKAKAQAQQATTKAAKCFEPVRVLPARVKDVTGERFGKLVAVEFGWVPNGKARTAGWHCRCECGGSTVVRGSDLRRGTIKSCGCVKRPHGRAGTPEYIAWQSMRRRCANPRTTSFENYGGRGIKVCRRWRKFENFYAYMGQRPSPEHSLDRWPNKDGNYMPGNVRWATPTEQARNTRANRLLSHDGQTLVLTEWAERTGVGASTLRERLRHGWNVADALTKPPQPKACKRGPIAHDGRTMSVAAWSREVGLSSNTIRARLDHGWRPSDALTRPLQRGRRAAA
jgi:hypothetical protein